MHSLSTICFAFHDQLRWTPGFTQSPDHLKRFFLLFLPTCPKHAQDSQQHSTASLQRYLQEKAFLPFFEEAFLKLKLYVFQAGEIFDSLLHKWRSFWSHGYDHKFFLFVRWIYSLLCNHFPSAKYLFQTQNRNIHTTGKKIEQKLKCADVVLVLPPAQDSVQRQENPKHAYTHKLKGFRRECAVYNLSQGKYYLSEC